MPLADETAALLALRDGSVLSHFSAAVLWGLEVTRRGDHSIHAVVAHSSGGHPRGVRLHRVAALADDDVCIREGLPVTSPLLTLLQLAPVLSARTLELAISRALYLRHIREPQLDELARRAAGRPGAATVRAALGETIAPGFTASDAERRLLELIKQAELPMPTINHRRGRVFPDFIWTDRHVIVELDDWRSHRARTAFERDRQRDARHAAEGLVTIRVTVRQLVEEPVAVIARLAAALALSRFAQRRG